MRSMAEKRGHGMLEDTLPFAEDEISREHERFAFIAFAEKSKQHLQLSLLDTPPDPPVTLE